MTLDDRQVSPPGGFLVRKGSGNCYFDFAQEISFTQPQFQLTAAPSTPTNVNPSVLSRYVVTQ